MKCKKCGNEILSTDLTCPHCDYGMDAHIENENPNEIPLKDQKFSAFTKYPKKVKSYKKTHGIYAILNLYKNAFDFHGYSGWFEYWTQQLYLFVLSITFTLMRNAYIVSPDTYSSIGKIILYSLAILIILTLIPSLSATVRRLHDTGRSGYLVLLTFIPFFGSLILLFLTLAPSE